MAAKKREAKAEQKQVEAYERMMERTHAAMESAPKEHRPPLRKSLEEAREKAVELGELTREEAQRIAQFLQRDIEDAAHYLSESGREMSDWFRFDLRLLEERMIEMFSSVADQTRLELLELEERARLASEYRTGELTGPGTLECAGCSKLMQFVKAGHIPPCPQCHGTVFHRHGEPQSEAEE